MQYIRSKKQPANQLTKIESTIDFLRQLSFLQGQQQGIDNLIQRYNDVHRNKPITIHTPTTNNNNNSYAYCIMCTSQHAFSYLVAKTKTTDISSESLSERLHLADQLCKHNTTRQYTIVQLNAQRITDKPRIQRSIQWHPTTY